MRSSISSESRASPSRPDARRRRRSVATLHRPPHPPTSTSRFAARCARLRAPCSHASSRSSHDTLNRVRALRHASATASATVCARMASSFSACTRTRIACMSARLACSSDCTEACDRSAAASATMPPLDRHASMASARHTLGSSIATRSAAMRRACASRSVPSRRAASLNARSMRCSSAAGTTPDASCSAARSRFTERRYSCTPSTRSAGLSPAA